MLVAITRLGDLLQASPTIVGLKRENPQAKITVLVDKTFAQICYGIPDIDEVYEIDLSMLIRCMERESEGIIDAYRVVETVVSDLRKQNFDLVLNISSSAYTAVLLRLLNIKNSQGWISDDQGQRLISNPWSVLFAAFVYHSNRDYNSINLVDIVRCSAGVKNHPKRLIYNVPQKAKSFPDEFLKSVGLDKQSGPLICVQAGASQEKRQWSKEKFASLLEQLVTKLNARVILTGSPKELPLIDSILRLYHHPRVHSVAGRTDLGQLAAILERADLLITGDTGPMHLAVAVGTPVVALFLASALCFETGPYGEGNIVIQPQIACNPCNPNYPCARPDCHEQISPELVTFLTQKRLEISQGSEQALKIPRTIADPNEVAIYLTAFDKDNFLDFVQLNQSEKVSVGDEERAKIAYRQLWKEEFGAIAKKDNEENGTLQPSLTSQPKLTNTSKLPILDTCQSGLTEAIRLTGEGVKLINDLTMLIHDRSSPPAKLGLINKGLEEIDRSLEELGLSYPVLGALTRVFILEKSNMRGEDPLLLASEMKGLYEILHRRSRKFGELFVSASQ